jgi:hypothetical protein
MLLCAVPGAHVGCPPYGRPYGRRDALVLRVEDRTIRESHNKQIEMIYAYVELAELYDINPSEQP